MYDVYKKKKKYLILISLPAHNTSVSTTRKIRGVIFRTFTKALWAMLHPVLPEKRKG